MVETVVIGVTTVIFGIATLLLVSKARKRLSEGSLRNYMDNFSVCLAFIVTFSLWQTIRDLLNFKVMGNGLIANPEYLLILFAYAAFVITAFRIIKISEEFGFKEDAAKINEIISKHKVINKKKKI